jgi:membrane-bound metal-dependent hydrolase YbcI (DUF457 family)
VLLWFVATSVLTIHLVFTDPRFDYRPLVVGALLPDLVDAPFGGARAMHSLTTPVVLVVVAMAVSVGRRQLRRRLLAVPIGILLHIVFDGAFTDTHVFWWPFSGGFHGARLPIVERGIALDVLLEAIGLALVVWSWRAFGLADPERRRWFVRTGQLTRTSPPT